MRARSWRGSARAHASASSRCCARRVICPALCLPQRACAQAGGGLLPTAVHLLAVPAMQLASMAVSRCIGQPINGKVELTDVSRQRWKSCFAHMEPGLLLPQHVCVIAVNRNNTHKAGGETQNVRPRLTRLRGGPAAAGPARGERARADRRRAAGAAPRGLQQAAGQPVAHPPHVAL